MGNKLYVGNLPFSFDETKLQSVFAEVGTVSSAKIITDRDTGRSKGFGFVEMATEEAAAEAVAKLNETDLDGRIIRVAIAQPREERPRREFNNAA